MKQKIKQRFKLTDMNTVCVHYVNRSSCKIEFTFKPDKFGHTAGILIKEQCMYACL